MESNCSGSSNITLTEERLTMTRTTNVNSQIKPTQATNRTCGLRVKTDVKAGPSVFGLD